MNIPNDGLQMNYTCDSCGKSFLAPATTPAEKLICPHCRKPLLMDADRQKAAVAGNILGQQWQDSHKEK